MDQTASKLNNPFLLFCYNWEVWLTYEVLETLKAEVGEESHHEGVLEEGDVLEVAGGADTGLSEQQAVDVLHPGAVFSSPLMCNSLDLENKIHPNFAVK